MMNSLLRYVAVPSELRLGANRKFSRSDQTNHQGCGEDGVDTVTLLSEHC